MSSVKKSAVTLTPVRNYQRELDQLYKRRTAIDSLIASLVQYGRYQAHSSTRVGQRKSA